MHLLDKRFPRLNLPARGAPRTAYAVLLFAALSILAPALCRAAQDERFPQTPAEFLVNKDNALLQSAVRQDSATLRELEAAASTHGGFKDAADLTDHAVALLALGRTKDARDQLIQATERTRGDALLTRRINLVSFFVSLRDRSFAEAASRLKDACSTQDDADSVVCAHLAARVASLSGDRETALAAIRQLHQRTGIVTFPDHFFPNNASWDAVRVSDYVVMKSFDEPLWDVYHQDWQRATVRSNYISKYDVTSSRSFEDAWQSLDKLVKFEFELGNFDAALGWLKEFEVGALSHDWQLPIERTGYAARAYFGMGRQAEAEEALAGTEQWLRDTFKQPTEFYFASLDFVATFDVPGLEALAIPRLRKIWDTASKQKAVDARLAAFEAGITLLADYERTADLTAFEQMRQAILPLAGALQGQIPDRWPGRRFDLTWVELRTAQAILNYDARPERLMASAERLEQALLVLKRKIDLTRYANLQEAKDAKDRIAAADSKVNKTDREIVAASDLEYELIPLLARLYMRLKLWDKAAPLLESSYYLTMREFVCGRPREQVAITIELLQVALERKNEADIKNWDGETRACLLAWDNKSPQLAWLLAWDARRYATNGNLYAAEFALARAIFIQRQMDRPRDRQLAAYLEQYADLLNEEGDAPHALELMKSAAEIVTAIDQARWSADEKAIVEAQIAHYADLATNLNALPARNSLLEAGFQLSQYWLNNDAGRAVEALARRNKLGNEKLSALIQQRDQLYYQSELLDHQFATVLGTTDARTVLQRRQNIAARERSVDGAIRTIDDAIAAQNTLLAPQILTITEAQALIGKDQVLIYFVVGSNEIIRWTLSRSQVAVKHLAITRQHLSAMLARIRCSVDSSAWTLDDARHLRSCADREPLTDYSNFDVLDLPFDLATASQLFDALFDTNPTSRSASEWTIIPSGELASLSFAVLATSLPPPKSDRNIDLDKVGWLGRQYALSTVPSVASLRDFKHQPSKAVRAYIGFGNPALLREDSFPELQSCGDKQETFCSARSMPKSTSSGKNNLHQATFPPLPQTACEICAIGAYFRKDGQGQDSKIVLGAGMTRAAVKALGAPRAGDGRSELQDYRVVHFATHGLMTGEIANEEPGLVMSAARADVRPVATNILTAGDIADLRLDAEWVILSACNTAAGRERGGEAFSGLARAFLYAGARSVLVSHWSVSTNAALRISTSAMRALVFDPDLSRAQALQSAINNILSEGRAERDAVKLHPAYWGPFAIVGAIRE
jgi:CHAT domain-containing protein